MQQWLAAALEIPTVPFRGSRVPTGWLAVAVLGVTAGCSGTKGEGSGPGECTDSIDNDENGLMDCADPGCAGSPDCQPTDSGDTPPEDTADTADSGDPGPDGSWVSEMGWIEVAAGEFTMGATEAEVEHPDNESPRTIRLTYAYEIGSTEVPVALYEHLTGQTTDNTCGADCPVTALSWHQAAALTVVMSESVGLAGCYSCSAGSGEDYCVPLGQPMWCEGYRLPTEAEWERAARAGTATIYAGSDSVDAVAWTTNNAEGTAHPVGALEPNAWGGHDFSGNAWEWCHDLWAEQPDPDDLTDPTGPTTGEFRVMRGGAYDAAPTEARAANRESADPAVAGGSVGLRVARTLDP